LIPVGQVVRKASALVVPNDQERKRIGRIARLALSRTRAASARFPEVRGVVLGGSFAKGTWLPESADIDIFVKVATKTPEPRFEEVGLAIGAEAMQGYPRGKMYAQHPYTEAAVDGVKVNIVPCYAVARGRWMSAADRSPFHVRLVKRLSEGQKAQVRLLKRFMKAVGVYGAEIETQGFSGYVAEVLVMQHGSFIGVLRYIAGYRAKGAERLFSLPDPVDPSRDLGIAVSGEKLGRLVLACREFLSRPQEAFFKRMVGKERPSISDTVVAVVFGHRRLSEDILWGELRKTARHVVKHVEGRGFRIARAMAASNNSDRSALLLIPEFASLPPIEQRVGPTVDMRKETHDFILHNRAKARLVWVDDDARVRLLQERDYTSLNRLLEDMAKGRSGPVGASEEVARGMARSARVLSGRGLSRLAESEEWIANGIREITSDAIGARGS
jgi:tRNA nucleotidyltransferase (CCA-adding enzyme)